MTDLNPPEPTFGLGELIRAKRVYLGLSQRELARTIPIDRRTYQRIENGTEQCPTGFVDTMDKLLDAFDREVEETTGAAERMIGANNVAGAVHFNVNTDEDPAHVWTRAVIGRAAVESGLIVPEARPEELVTTHDGRRT